MYKKFQTISLSKKLILLTLCGLIPVFCLFQFYIFPKTTSLLMESYKTKLKNTVEVAKGIMEVQHKRALDGELTQEEAKKVSMQIINGLRYEGAEYFWIHDLDLKMVMHPTQPKLNGTDISQNADPNGKFLFREMNDVVKAHNDGFVEYMWPKPGHDVPVEKISYVFYFKPWGFVIGSGIYFDYIRGQINGLRNIFLFGFSFATLISCVLVGFFAQSLAKTFRQVVQTLTHAGNEMNSLSSRLSETGTQVADSVSESASCIQETASSMEEIGMISQKNADYSHETQLTAASCLEATRQGKQSMQQLITCMDQIIESNKDVLKQNEISGSQMEEIIQMINEINTKTRVINDIVFQTKLLSFNASVESARAGEAGKGFAVVAEEVGNLAEMSGKAAHEIEESLGSSIRRIEQIIGENMNISKKKIEVAGEKIIEGTHVVKSCEDTLNIIFTKINEVNTLSGEISLRCNEQKQGIDQMNTAIRELNNTSQKNAEASSDVATSVESISQQAKLVLLHTNDINRMIEGEEAA